MGGIRVFFKLLIIKELIGSPLRDRLWGQGLQHPGEPAPVTPSIETYELKASKRDPESIAEN
jgi:hypothetical protein